MERKQKLFLLKRTISFYSGEDLFLGIYDTSELANTQKDKYIEICKTYDKWAEQAYHDVNLVEDLKIIEVEEKLESKIKLAKGQLIYLINELSEGFGQITKSLFFISTDKNRVDNFIQEKEEEEDEGKIFPPYYEYEVLTLNELNLSVK